MNWSEFQKARLLMAEERVGTRVRNEQTAEVDSFEATKTLLRDRGQVA